MKKLHLSGHPQQPDPPSMFSIWCLHGDVSLQFHFYGDIEDAQARIVSSYIIKTA